MADSKQVCISGTPSQDLRLSNRTFGRVRAADCVLRRPRQRRSKITKRLARVSWAFQLKGNIHHSWEVSLLIRSLSPKPCLLSFILDYELRFDLVTNFVFLACTADYIQFRSLLELQLRLLVSSNVSIIYIYYLLFLLSDQ